jgi:hypothetical protein
MCWPSMVVGKRGHGDVSPWLEEQGWRATATGDRSKNRVCGGWRLGYKAGVRDMASRASPYSNRAAKGARSSRRSGTVPVLIVKPQAPGYFCERIMSPLCCSGSTASQTRTFRAPSTRSPAAQRPVATGLQATRRARSRRSRAGPEGIEAMPLRSERLGLSQRPR